MGAVHGIARTFMGFHRNAMAVSAIGFYGVALRFHGINYHMLIP